MARHVDSQCVLPLFCDDLIASTVDMSPARFGAYVRILCYAWTRGGVPNDEAACGRIAGGFEPGDWLAISGRLCVLDAGQATERLSHRRLELERVAVAELKAKKSEAGKEGNRVRWGADRSQTDRKRIAERSQTASQTDRKTIAPTPTPTPVKEFTHTAGAGEEFRQPGWAADEWARFVEVWNRTKRANPWKPLTPPAGWVDAAAVPGWLDKARQALDRLPRCAFFANPLAVTQFLADGYADRILAGEFDNAKAAPRGGRSAPDSPMTLDEKVELARRERASKPAWRRPPAGCPDDLAGRLFNAMLSETQYRKNLESYREEMAARASSVPQVAKVAPALAPDTLGTQIGPEIESQEFFGDGDEDESQEYEYPDPIRDGWIGRDGRP